MPMPAIFHTSHADMDPLIVDNGAPESQNQNLITKMYCRNPLLLSVVLCYLLTDMSTYVLLVTQN